VHISGLFSAIRNFVSAQYGCCRFRIYLNRDQIVTHPVLRQILGRQCMNTMVAQRIFRVMRQESISDGPVHGQAL
jgi:hypothetical protein